MKKFISELQLRELCQKFCIKVFEKKERYKTLVIITKWWLIPWYYIADILWIKDIRTICIESYNDEDNLASLVERYFCDLWDTDDILVFDELIDTWWTLSYIRSKLPKDKNIKFGVLYRNKDNFMPDIYVEEKGDEWIDFYYETKL